MFGYVKALRQDFKTPYTVRQNFFFFGHAWDMQTFPGQGNLCHNSDNTTSLTHGAVSGLFYSIGLLVCH